MKNNITKIGKALLLPVAVFPLAAILIGVGYSLEKLDIESIFFLAYLLKTLGEVILNNMPLIFSISIAYELSYTKSLMCAFNGLLSFLIVTSLLSPENIALFQNIDISSVDVAFQQINNQFIGILSGLIAVFCFNSFSKKNYNFTQRLFISTLVTILCVGTLSLILYYLWPAIYSVLIAFGKFISSKGPIGAGIYAFFNRLLIPFGLHHALNSVFWFDVIGINDIGNFWSSTGTIGVTGMYQAGFYPIMMFGLPGAALAMYKTAQPERKKEVAAFLMSASIASFFTGLTEPLEFSFVYLAPLLYLWHAFLTGVCVFICATFEWIVGFSFSAGFIDFLLGYNMPFSKQPLMLLVMGLVMFFMYYFSFVYLIKKYNFTTIGREKTNRELLTHLSREELDHIIDIIVESVGGIENIKAVDCCITRLRLQLYNPIYFNYLEIQESGAFEYRQINDEYQIIYGTQAEIIYLELLERLSDECI